jgi:hypothetical protein
MQKGLIVATNAKEFNRKLFRKIPVIFNAELNRGMNSAQGGFNKWFTKARLNKSGIKVKTRKGFKAKKKQKGSPKVPVKMKFVGFRSYLLGRKELKNKATTTRSLAPLVLAHEHGRTITKPFSIKIDTEQKRKRAMRNQPKKEKQKMRGRSLPFYIFVKKKVVIPANLGFKSYWRSNKGQLLAGLEAAKARALGALERIRIAGAQVKK